MNSRSQRRTITRLAGALALQPLLLRAGQARPLGAPAAPVRPAPSAAPKLQPVQLPFAGYLRSARASDDEPGSRIAQATYSMSIEGAGYRLVLSVDSALANLRYESSGTLDARGLHPMRYRETRRLPLRHEATREVLFVAPGTDAAVAALEGGADTARIAVPEGAQDRVSVIAQLGWLVRTDPQRLAPGRELTVPLAGWDKVEPVRVVAGAPESIVIEDGQRRSARRFRRVDDDPAAAGIDIWLADDAQALPLIIGFADRDRGLRFVRSAG